MNEEKKDIRFIAVDYGDPEIQKLMSNDDNSFVEINKEKFERQNDCLETSFRTMNNYVSLTGSLLAPAKVINHGPHQFIYAQLIVDTGYFKPTNEIKQMIGRSGVHYNGKLILVFDKNKNKYFVRLYKRPQD